MQPLLVCILVCRRFGETFENTQWKTVKQILPMRVWVDPSSYAGPALHYDEESDHSNKTVRKTPEIESGHKVSEEVK